MDPLSALVLLLLAASLVGWASGRRQIRELRAEIAGLQSTAVVSIAPAMPTTTIDPTPLPGAGGALAKPPADLGISLAYIRTHYSHGRFTMPLGWTLINNKPACVGASFMGDINHILITGRSDAGKDNAAMGMLLSLALTYTPEQAQIAIIDGKGGLDWANWANKRHVAHIAMDSKDIPPVMQALKAERERRTQKLRGLVSKWDEYKGGDLPLLVVYVAELSLLQAAIGKGALGDWLTEELVSSRALGIRYIIASQDVANLDTTWRRQISLFMAGTQNTQSADMPNTGLYTKDLEALGAVPPSQLPSGRNGAGVFTCIHDRDVAVVRTVLLTDQERTRLLAELPNKSLQQANKIQPAVARPATDSEQNNEMLAKLLAGQVLPFEDEATESGSSNGSTAFPRFQGPKSTFGSTVALGSTPEKMSATGTTLPLVVAVEEVPAEEQQQILAAAQTARSRSQICQELYGVRGGRPWRKVQAVCDAAGLLLPAPAGQTVAA